MEMEPALVEVLDWTPAWEERFARARAELLTVLPADATIEHVGSTSVPGLAAKPIIDILVTTSRVDELRTDMQAIQALGYYYNPKYFADDLDHLFLRRDADGRRAEHLHIFHPRSPAPQSDRTFRDYLIAHPDAAQRYGEAKRAAAQINPESRGQYGQAKEAVLQELLHSARAWAAESGNYSRRYARISTAHHAQSQSV
jgi:GrpB-like predicted nucleotidyltransferase (UPF0157 family)